MREHDVTVICDLCQHARKLEKDQNYPSGFDSITFSFPKIQYTRLDLCENCVQRVIEALVDAGILVRESEEKVKGVWIRE